VHSGFGIEEVLAAVGRNLQLEPAYLAISNRNHKAMKRSGITWRHARTLAAERGVDDSNETAVARVLDDLLTRAQAGPVDRRSDRVTARGRVAAATHRPPSRDDSAADADNEAETPLATVIPFGVFDADAEASRW